jgi:hypothetical protein
MSGKSITQQQVKLYMSYRTKQSQVQAAAKAGISQRSARRIEKMNVKPIKDPGNIVLAGILLMACLKNT